MNTTTRLIVTGILIILVGIYANGAGYNNGVKDGQLLVTSQIVRWNATCKKSDPETNVLKVFGKHYATSTTDTITLDQTTFDCPNN